MMDDLAKQILEALEDYSEEVEEIVEDEIENVANEAVAELKSNSPKRTGKYAKSWRKTKIKDGYSVHNTKAGLTHLLEKGHAKRNGGRTKAIPHIAPVEQMVIKDLENNISRRVQK